MKFTNDDLRHTVRFYANGMMHVEALEKELRKGVEDPVESADPGFDRLHLKVRRAEIELMRSKLELARYCKSKLER